jgi:hypothetical protein
MFAGVTWLFYKPQATHLPITSAAVLGLLSAFMYWGWKFLAKQFPSWWIGGGIVWLVCMMTKLLTAYFVGVIVGPIKIAQSLWTIYSMARLRRRIANQQI